MPSKRKTSGAKKKAKEEEKKRKRAEKKLRPKVDPSFGLKRKKGRANRTAVQNAYQNMHQDEIRATQKREDKKMARAARERKQSEFEDLYRTVDGDSLFLTDKAKRRKKREGRAVEEKKEEVIVEVETEDLTLMDLDSLDATAPDFEETLDKIFLAMHKKRESDPEYGSRVTLESFAEWNKTWKAKKTEKKMARTKKKMQRKGKKSLTGRELFSIDESAFVDDDAAETEYVFEKEQLRLLSAADSSAKTDVSSAVEMGDASDTLKSAASVTSLDATTDSTAIESTAKSEAVISVTSTAAADVSASVSTVMADVTISDESLFLDADDL